MNFEIPTRHYKTEDISELCVLINEIIAIGGTTSNVNPLSDAELASKYINETNNICCFVALDEQGALAGFQSLEYRDDLPKDWADIATFARVEPKLRGVGSALFSSSLEFAKENGFVALNANIRADNTGGLAFYEKMGFETYKMNKDVPLATGEKVDRISKRLNLVPEKDFEE